ncbi:uncharacterized protein BO96DRAFT_203796 [Aspergillus niger CBS 101883]|uniref:uncharacterized protein n=1 Tax=Aspergillus lacticoffeatus (strain CBS 101883) TaxID=1450533 RepID=UPI000D7F2C1A|nr:uncharacterized protein BO96DRAFT_203796 [Aspergillus niger CBS 101883]PYH59217.1 hypothetical protein BO96DRAFT_203796 [Aspergillus niger CBS 101883]
MKGKDEKGGGWKEKRRRGIPSVRPVSFTVLIVTALRFTVVVLRSRDLRGGSVGFLLRGYSAKLGDNNLFKSCLLLVYTTTSPISAVSQDTGLLG